MKKRISYVIFLVSLLTLTVLCGCDKSTKSAQEKQEKTENQEQVTKEETDRKKNNTINLYYLNAQEDKAKRAIKPKPKLIFFNFIRYVLFFIYLSK